MDRSVATCPLWLENRINDFGGIISFFQFMDWSLNDPQYGAYATGRLKIGKQGDYATSPSLGSDFADLLAIQLVDWLKQLNKNTLSNQTLSLIDIGPGEGYLSRDLLLSIYKICPSICENLQLILIEPNEGMARRQKIVLQENNIVPIYWMNLKELEESPVTGVVIAHELLDVLPVERIIYRNKDLYRQGVSVDYHKGEAILNFVDIPLTSELKLSLKEVQDSINLHIPPINSPEGWCSEFHSELDGWFYKVSKILKKGCLLIVDYALNANRYYSPNRSSGTLLAYKNNVASGDLLIEPGLWDLTSHLCLDTLLFYALKNKWKYLGKIKQGEALLSLGLADKFNELSKKKLSIALEKRENLLRLVEPSGLGGFYWIALQFNSLNCNLEKELNVETIFLNGPIK